jgi:hypothetical protein
LKKTHHKNSVGGLAHGVGSEFKPQQQQQKFKYRSQKPRSPVIKVIFKHHYKDPLKGDFPQGKLGH